MNDLVIVGAGLFGRVIEKTLSRTGMKVSVIDDLRPHAGSPPAGCLMKPSWASSMVGSDYTKALELLDELYGVQEIKLSTGIKDVAVSKVRPSDVLKGDKFISRATGLSQTDAGWIVHTHGGDHEARKVVIATGFWAPELFPELKSKMKGRAGWSFFAKGHLTRSFMRIWAPYKQVIGFQRDEGEIWLGDGTTVKPEALDLDVIKMEKSRARCAAELNVSPGSLRVQGGIRPYMEGPKAPAFLQEQRPGLWVATGGAKNGTLGAAWSALRLREALR